MFHGTCASNSISGMQCLQNISSHFSMLQEAGSAEVQIRSRISSMQSPVWSLLLQTFPILELETEA